MTQVSQVPQVRLRLSKARHRHSTAAHGYEERSEVAVHSRVESSKSETNIYRSHSVVNDRFSNSPDATSRCSGASIIQQCLFGQTTFGLARLLRPPFSTAATVPHSSRFATKTNSRLGWGKLLAFVSRLPLASSAFAGLSARTFIA